MKVARTCPRCRERHYDWTKAAIGQSCRAVILCSGCGYEWTGRLTKVELGAAEKERK